MFRDRNSILLFRKKYKALRLISKSGITEQYSWRMATIEARFVFVLDYATTTGKLTFKLRADCFRNAGQLYDQSVLSCKKIYMINVYIFT